MALLCPSVSEGDLHTNVDQFLADRWGVDTELSKSLAKQISEEKVSLTALERIIRSGWTVPGKSPYDLDKITQNVPLTCDHVDYTTSFHLFVPKGYDSSKSYPLVIMGHGGNGAMSYDYANSTAMSYIRTWIDVAKERDYIVAAPLTERGWGWIGDSVIFSMISKLQRELNIDPDKILMSGHSMGGHLSWRSALSYPDRWATVSPMSGGYDFVERGTVPLLFNVPGFATYGSSEPFDINTFNKKIWGYVSERNYDWVMEERPGNHGIFTDRFPLIADFFEKRPRDLYRKEIFVKHFGLPWFDKAEPKRAGWSQGHTWIKERTIDRRTFHWIQLDDFEEGEENRWRVVDARITDRRTITLQTSGVKKLKIFLHPTMLNGEQGVRVIVNGKEQEHHFDQNPMTMLKLARNFDDRGRIYWGSLTINIDSDAEVSDR